MPNPRQMTLLLVTLLALTPVAIAADDLGEPLTGLLAGKVSSSSTPLPSSQVYAYQLAPRATAFLGILILGLLWSLWLSSLWNWIRGSEPLPYPTRRDD